MPADSATLLPDATPVDMVLEAFNQSITLDVSAALWAGEDVPVLAYDCSAVYYVATSDARSIFRFYTDDFANLDPGSADLAANPDQIHFGINTAAAAIGSAGSWAELDPAAAQCLDMSAIEVKSVSNAVPANKTFVANDFLRYLALCLFQTPKATDVFQNQENVLDSIHTLSKTQWGSEVITKMTNGDFGTVANSKPYITTDSDDANNICCFLFKQLIKANPHRFYDMSANSGNGQIIPDADGFYPIPFSDGDSISFVLTVSPATGQKEATGLADDILPRKYRIVLKMVDGEATSVAPAVDGINPLRDDLEALST